jgi:hypothetical protein
MTTTPRTVILAALLSFACDEGSDPTHAAPAPAGYSDYLVYIGDGSWDPADPSYTPPTLADIQRDLWKYSDAEVQQFEADAAAFFLARFGVDVDDPANAERIVFGPALADPRALYRVVTMAEREVPPEGWPVSDAALLVTIVDPAGFELGGEFAGVTAPAGSTMTFGRYHITTDTGEAIEIDFRSLAPYTIDAFGAAVVRCEVSSALLGEGEGNAMFRLSQGLDGTFSVTIRNVLTFTP